eukprot:6479342-Amphidinium_carterae.1
MKVPVAPSEEEKRHHNLTETHSLPARNGELQVPLLAAIDNVYHRTLAVWVPLKGAEEYAVKSIRIFIQSMGIPSG